MGQNVVLTNEKITEALERAREKTEDHVRLVVRESDVRIYTKACRDTDADSMITSMRTDDPDYVMVFGVKRKERWED